METEEDSLARAINGLDNRTCNWMMYLSLICGSILLKYYLIFWYQPNFLTFGMGRPVMYDTETLGRRERATVG